MQVMHSVIECLLASHYWREAVAGHHDIRARIALLIVAFAHAAHALMPILAH
jgi:hypothetical protein